MYEHTNPTYMYTIVCSIFNNHCKSKDLEFVRHQAINDIYFTELLVK